MINLSLLKMESYSFDSIVQTTNKANMARAGGYQDIFTQVSPAFSSEALNALLASCYTSAFERPSDPTQACVNETLANACNTYNRGLFCANMGSESKFSVTHCDTDNRAHDAGTMPEKVRMAAKALEKAGEGVRAHGNDSAQIFGPDGQLAKVTVGPHSEDRCNQNAIDMLRMMQSAPN